MGDRRCCCPEDCYSFRDDFTQAGTATDLGTNWEECTGDWYVTADHLTVVGNGIVVLKKMPGVQVGKFQIWIDELTAGAVYSIIAFYGERLTPCASTTKYWRLRLTMTDSTHGTLDLVSPSGDIVDTDDVILNTPSIGMDLCVGPERIDGNSTGTLHILGCLCDWNGAGTGSGIGTGSTCDHEGYYFAIQNESSQTLKVDWAYFIDHYSHNTLCPDCVCGCEGHCFPDVLYATLRDEFLCARQEGVQFTLIREPNTCVWEMPSTTWGGCAIKLSLSGAGAEEYSPETVWILTDELVGIPFTPIINSTCNPVYLKYTGMKNSLDTPICPAGWTCCNGDCIPPPYPGNQGYYSIEITE